MFDVLRSVAGDPQECLTLTITLAEIAAGMAIRWQGSETKATDLLDGVRRLFIAEQPNGPA